MANNQQPLEKTALNIAGEKHNQIIITTMNRKLMNYLAALLLVLCAVWNIRCESESYLSEVTIEKQRQQAAFLQYIHENSKPYKQSLKQDSIFALKLDSIERQAKVLK